MAIDNEVPAENAQRLPFEFTNLSSNVQTTKSIFVADSLSSISAEVSATMIKNQHKHIQNDIKTPNAHPSNHPNDHHPQTQMFTHPHRNTHHPTIIQPSSTHRHLGGWQECLGRQRRRAERNALLQGHGADVGPTSNVGAQRWP